MESQFKQYKRIKIAELRPVTHAECRGFHQSPTTKGFLMKPVLMSDGVEVSISAEDRKNGSPKIGDMIARNPENHEDQWLITEDYFKENFAELC